MAVSVEDLRDELVRLGLSKEESESIKGKANLMAKVRELGQYNPFDGLEVEGTDVGSFANKEHKDNEYIPEFGSVDWQDYVLSLLTSNEYADVGGERFPKAAGLRRVAQIVLGDIIECGPRIVFPAKDDNSSGRATVVYEVRIAWKADIPKWWTSENLETAELPTRTFSDVAEAWHGNTPDKFAVHPAATASSRAMGRALKSALCINVLTAEEMTNDKDPSQYSGPAERVNTGEYTEEGLINSNQKEVITKLCERLGINVYKFINISHYEFGENIKYASIDTVPKSKATLMIKQLNIYQTCTDESEQVPDSIKEKK